MHQRFSATRVALLLCHAKARSAPYTTLMVTPATIASCIRFENVCNSGLKKNSGRNGRKNPATTPLKSVTKSPLLAVVICPD